MNVTGTAVQGLEPDGAGARLPRRPHPPRRLPVPRRPLPLRAAVEPVRRDGRAARLRRPLARTAPAAVVENFFSTGSPVGTHSPEGWPSFAGWPRDESLTHEGTYWKWIERAWRSGLRIMVNDLVENRALCELYPLKQNNCNEMVSAYQQADDMYALQDYIDAQFGGPGKGFLRIVKTPGRGAQGDQRGQARDGARRRGLRGAQLRAVQRHAEVHHRADRQRARPAVRRSACARCSRSTSSTTRSAARKFDSGATGVLVNTGNKYATGQFWTAEHCDDPDHDNEPTNPTGEHAATFYTLFGPVLDAAAVPGPAAGLSARAALQPEGPDARSAST